MKFEIERKTKEGLPPRITTQGGFALSGWQITPPRV